VNVPKPATTARTATKTTTISRGTETVKRSLLVRGTAYTAYCAGCSGVTATGLDLRGNPNMKVIAVDPRVIKLGSLVRLSSKSYPQINGVYVAGDTGGAIKGNKIDIFVSSESKARQFGVRNDIVLEILREGY